MTTFLCDDCGKPFKAKVTGFFCPSCCRKRNGYKFGEWIPVSERLPETFGEYLVVVKRNTGEIYSDYADFDPFTKRWTTGLFFDIGSKVTHWMPLPEPPQEK